MEDILLPLLVTKSKFIFDLRGEMAATTTNKVSSLSQAHFDEILVLVEHNSTTFTLKPNRNCISI